MAQPNATDPTADCRRCSIAAVCSEHAKFATQERPTAAALIAGVGRGRWVGHAGGDNAGGYRLDQH